MKYIKAISILLAGFLFSAAFPHTSALTAGPNEAASAYTANSDTRGSYAEYLKAYSEKKHPENPVNIDVSKYTFSADMDARWSENTPEEPCVETGEEGSITWNIPAVEEGLYQIQIRYLPLPGKGLEIERALQIDGKTPFSEAGALRFSRVYQDNPEKRYDNNGNQYRSEVKEAQIWQNIILSGSSNYSVKSYYFYLSEGEHTLTLISKSEPMAISKIALVNSDSIKEYKAAAREYSQAGYKNADCEPIFIEAESAGLKSDMSLYSVNDSKSPATSPSSSSRLLLNCEGGRQWSKIDQWISWEIDVPQDGLYKIMLRAKQNFLQENVSGRALLIDDKIPFAEAGNISFGYSLNWQIVTIGAGEPYLFYLEKGPHTIKLQNIYGDISTVLSQMEGSLFRLNEAYRKILMYTGAYPDANRDYDIEANLPEVIEIFREQQPVLQSICEILPKVTKGKGTYYASVQKMLIQINNFIKDPETVPAQLEYFRNNISENSTWMISASEQPLLLDYLIVAPPDTPAPKAEASWLKRLSYMLETLFYSFTRDYYNISGSGAEAQNITLWMGTAGVTQIGSATTSGRDQAQLLRVLTGNYFTPLHKIGVDIRLVDLSALLPAVAAGQGPDVAINQEKTVPVNYALRNALANLSEFPDVEEVLSRFDKSSVTPYYIGDDLFALPETHIFSMMFWRTDILKELGFSPPQTWEEVYALLPALQQNYMDIGLPNLTEDNPEMFLTFLYQSGESVYNENVTKTNLDSDKSVAAFKEWTELYTKYKITQKMDSLTRFRTGEAPVIIQPFTFYNYLTSVAPEIKGLWDFGPVPGVKTGDGTIDKSNVSSGTAAIILKGGAGDGGDAWEFLKWWTQADTQIRFGRELEIILGSAARWPTANDEALEALWAPKPLANIKEQKKFTKGLPEAAGGYLTSRYLSSAVRLAVNNAVDPRETLLNWNSKINKEIEFMRSQYGLNTK